MRDFIVIGIVCLVALIIGASLFFFGPASLQSDVGTIFTTKSSKGLSFNVLVQGDNASEGDERTNYRVTSREQLQQLWTMVYGTAAPSTPTIDFTKYEVLALFDGSHATTGYSIKTDSIHDLDGIRTISISHGVPDVTCHTSTAITSPFQIIQVPITANSLSHVDMVSTTTCP